MHKYFAKPLFLGKKVLFLPECQSTNAELIEHLRKTPQAEGYVILTDHQTKGRGQRGNVWLSEAGKNLLFSIYLKPSFLHPKEGYLLNIIAGLGVTDAFAELVKGVELKWPNDIYIQDKKVGGVLIEQQIDSLGIHTAVVGIGLNINQTHFNHPGAISLKEILGQNIDRDQFLEEVLSGIEKSYLLLRAGKKEYLLRRYYEVMRWRGEKHTFRSEGGEFEGEIIGINEFGRLVLKTNGLSKSFDVQEITFLY